MSLIFPANPLLHLLTTDQTHKNLAQNKNSCYFLISRFYVVHLRCSPQYNWQRLRSIFIYLPQKTVFPYYFINVSVIFMLYISVVPHNTIDKDCQVFSYPFHKKQYFHITLLFYQCKLLFFNLWPIVANVSKKIMLKIGL